MHVNSKLLYLAKNVGILAVSNFASKILIFLLVPLYTSVLSTEEYGTYDLVVTSVQLIFPIITLNIIDAVMRFCMKKDLPITDVASIGMGFVLKSLPIVIILLLVVYIFDFFTEITPYVVYAFFYYLFYVLNQYFIQLAKGCEKVKDMAVAGIISTVTMIILNIFFLIVVKLGLSGFFLANIVSLALSVFYFAFRLKILKLISLKKKNKQLRKDMLSYSVPLITSAVSWWVNSSASKYIVVFFCGIAANGLLSVAYKIPNIMSVIQGVFIQAWQISAIKENESKNAKTFYSNTYTVMNMAMVFICSVLILLTKCIAKVLFAKEFFGAWEYVPFLLVASVFNASSGYLGAILAAQNKSKSMAKSAIYGSLVNILLGIVLVYFIGIQGATIATMIASLVIYIIRHRELEFILFGKNYKYNLIAWILLVVQSIFAVYTDIYLVQMSILLGLVVVFRTYIYDLIKKVFSIIKKQNQR